jgi:hypothetical protein
MKKLNNINGIESSTIVSEALRICRETPVLVGRHPGGQRKLVDCSSRETLVGVELTKEVVDGLLSRNRFNRGVISTAIDRYSKMIADGKWVDNFGLAIYVCSNGTLINGQHRLMAIQKCGYPKGLKVILDIGVSDYMIHGMDTESVRRPATVLALCEQRTKMASNTGMTIGEVMSIPKDMKTFKPIASIIVSNGGSALYKKPSGSGVGIDILEGVFHEFEVEIRRMHSLKYCPSMPEKGVLPFVAAACELSKRTGTLDIVSEFMQRVILGENLHRGMAEYALREYIQSPTTKTLSRGASAQSDKYSMTLEVISRFLLGESQVIRIQADGMKYSKVLEKFGDTFTSSRLPIP